PLDLLSKRTCELFRPLSLMITLNTSIRKADLGHRNDFFKSRKCKNLIGTLDDLWTKESLLDGRNLHQNAPAHAMQKPHIGRRSFNLSISDPGNIARRKFRKITEGIQKKRIVILTFNSFPQS